ncbi:Uu.00g099730.m01.CDS01 [Anthostomella pinea]|uniref:Uu.00g099730.m01.CDS01 n=1 Tax=Anthostomella pinea TaxID=933095 RepID=A0AAI8VCV3_9PEZI|nr:Uu.00g099730.m01.CDS01 [Anthostomella pinea]
MCRVSKQQTVVVSTCANGKGASCYHRTDSAVHSVAGKCTVCRRKDEQAQRLFGDRSAEASLSQGRDPGKA